MNGVSSIRLRRLNGLFLLLSLGVLVLHLAVSAVHLKWRMAGTEIFFEIFYLDSSLNISSQVSALMFVTVAILLVLAGVGSFGNHRGIRNSWYALSLLFFLMAFDKSSNFHEILEGHQSLMLAGLFAVLIFVLLGIARPLYAGLQPMVSRGLILGLAVYLLW